MLKMYAIANCSTVKKARQWLEENRIAYEFHDYKKEGVPAELIDDWLEQLGWESLVNKKGMTWRKLTEAQKDAVVDAQSAKAVMVAAPSLIKRPLMVKGEKVVALGFDAVQWQDIFEG